MNHLSGLFTLNDWCSTGKGITVDQQAGLTLEALGHPSPLQGTTSLLELYQSYGLSLTAYLRGSYLIAIHDGLAHRLTIFQDRMTSPVAFYYAAIDGKVFYSTSLKQLLARSGMPRQMNDEAIEEFIVNGYLYGEHTLLQNVQKLKAGHALVINKDGCKQMPVEYPREFLTAGEALSQWEERLAMAVRECVNDQKEICLPLSNGYDSNYILNALYQNPKNIHAFSVGGKYGKNELPQVLENLKVYPRVKLHTALTSPQTLQHFPDIVWRLEGAVYEVGVFLQYELAQLVKASGKGCLVCGECADQVMNLHFQEQERQVPAVAGTYYTFDEYPYIFGSQLILKKNGILFNSFDIETRYPYCDERFIAAANALAGINGKDKRCHVANCNDILPASVLKNLTKAGGATEFHSLFQNEAARRVLLSKIKKSSFYQKHRKIIEKHSYVESVRPRGKIWMKTMLRNALLSLLHIGQEDRQKNSYFLEEMELRDALCVLYLILFEKLFIDTDTSFISESCSCPLDSLC